MIRLATFTFATLALVGAACADTPVERGAYLVNTIMTCGNCHSPKGPPDVVAGKDFSGGLRFNEPPFDVTAPNITPDKDTGIGAWSDADIKKLLRTGVRPNGVPIAAVMPTGFYDIVTDADMDAIVAYLRTLKPISNKVPDPIYKMSAPRQVFPGAEKPADPARSDRHAQARLLPRHHRPLHGMPYADGQGPRRFREFAGQGRPRISRARGACRSRATSPRARPRASATGPTPRSSAPSRQGIDKDGNKLKPPMGYGYYAHMTDADLDAVIAWVRTLPAKE